MQPGDFLSGEDGDLQRGMDGCVVVEAPAQRRERGSRGAVRSGDCMLRRGEGWEVMQDPSRMRLP